MLSDPTNRYQAKNEVSFSDKTGNEEEHAVLDYLFIKWPITPINAHISGSKHRNNIMIIYFAYRLKTLVPFKYAVRKQ